MRAEILTAGTGKVPVASSLPISLRSSFARRRAMHAYARKPSAAISARMARKVVVAVLGCTVLALGIALIVLPGPAVVVIPLGLTILGSEFLWARRLLRRVKQDANRLLGGGTS
jgi:hypothetical protein